MELNLVERERITDGMLKIESARTSLETLDEHKIPFFQDIRACLNKAHQSLRSALGYARPPCSPAEQPPKRNTKKPNF